MSFSGISGYGVVPSAILTEHWEVGDDAECSKLFKDD